MPSHCWTSQVKQAAALCFRKLTSASARLLEQVAAAAVIHWLGF